MVNYHQLSLLKLNMSIFSAGVDTVNGARYTKSTETVEVHANPGDTEYAIPDIAQHYETVRDTNIMRL